VCFAVLGAVRVAVCVAMFVAVLVLYSVAQDFRYDIVCCSVLQCAAVCCIFSHCVLYCVAQDFRSKNCQKVFLVTFFFKFGLNLH